MINLFNVYIIHKAYIMLDYMFKKQNEKFESSCNRSNVQILRKIAKSNYSIEDSQG